MQNDFQIVEMLPGHAPEVARLHLEVIKTGFISSLGLDFITALYEAVAKSKSGFGFVAVRSQTLIGFVAFATNINALYKSVLWKKGLTFVCLLAGRVFSFRNLKQILETLFYPARTSRLNLPGSELLSVAVAAEQRRKGVAAALVKTGLAGCDARRIDKVKVLVDAGSKPANKLYLRCGFELAAQINNHGIKSNVYVGRTGCSHKPC